MGIVLQILGIVLIGLLFMASQLGARPCLMLLIIRIGLMEI